MRTVCCICNKTKTPQGWFVERVRSTESASHGYCPRCAEKVLKEIRDYQKTGILSQAI